jgi:putative transposase
MVERSRAWLQWVNEPQTTAEEEAMKQHIARGRPFGNDLWIRQTAKSLHLQQSLRPRGRPKGWRKEAKT